MSGDERSKRARFVASLKLYGWLLVAVVVLGFLGGVLIGQFQARYGSAGQPSEVTSEPG